MPTNVTLPQMGESIYEGTITKWLRKAGDAIKRDEPLYELSTDKVDTEIPSPVSGTLLEIKVKEGQKVPIHTVVAIVDESASPAAKPAGRQETTRKAVPAPEPAARPAPPPPAPAPAPAPAPVQSAPVSGESEKVFTSPLVRRMAREHNIDLSQVTGTGWQGRITKQDVQEYLNRGGKGAPTPVAPQPQAAAVAPVSARRVDGPPAAPPGVRVQSVPMSPMRVKIAEHMVLSRRTSAHVTTVFEVDVTGIVALREREKDNFETVHGTKLTYTPFFAMAAVEAIKEFPVINSSVEGTNILYKRDVNIGVAVALPEGLIVPVVKNAEEKSFLGLCRAINDLAERSRTKKLSLDDVQGGTFTITNPGIYGGMFGTPIISQPQVAIMGLGGIEKRPVVVNDAIAIRSMCYIVLSFDHRVIDGAIADQFLARVKSTLQNWKTPIQ